MSLSEIDIVVRVAGATLLIFAALSRLKGGNRADDRFFIPLALCLCGFLAGNTPDPSLRLSGAAGDAAIVLSGYAAVFLWWFCLAVFDRAFRPRGGVLIIGLAWIVVASADRGLFGPAAAQRGLSWVLIALGLAMMAYLAWRVFRDRDGDLIDQRRRARAAVVVLLAGQLLADMATDLVLGMDWSPQAFTVAQNAVLLAFTSWLLQLNLETGGVPSHPRSAPDRIGYSTAPEIVPSALEARLRVLMEVERVHLDPSLGFEAFVRMMGASERSVRHLINHQLGHDHFRTFLNAHRLAEAKRLLADPSRREDKLIAIAMDSGFASLPSFNRVFQDVERTTPSAFRRALLGPTNALEAPGQAT